MTSSFSPAAIYKSATLVELLRWRALHQPDRLAYTFLLDGEKDEATLNYRDLDHRARAIGGWLQANGMSGERVLLLYPAGLEYIAAFLGCLYAAAIAVPTYPPRLNRSLLRLQTIVADAQAKVALTTAPILTKIKPLLAQAPLLETMRWRSTDALTDDAAAEWHDPILSGDTIAFLQYTSGSTAAPKGVIVSHDNLIHNESLIKTKCRHTENSSFVGWLPLYHDMGLIGNVLQPLYAGIPSFLMSPMSFLERPVRWLEAISRYRGTTSGGPNFAYDLCVRKVTAAEQANLDLSSWDVAFNGAEPVRRETLARFASAFAHCGFRSAAFYPCYGLAEATLMVSGGPKELPPTVINVEESALRRREVVISDDTEDSKELVSSGEIPLDQKIIIADPESLVACLPNQIGEIWVAGPIVTRGYWNQPEQTKLFLRACLADTGEGPFLRTGDLGFLRDGELFVTGRIKDLIIIRGRNYYPQDIEFSAELSHPALRPGRCVAFPVDVNNQEQLVIVAEADPAYENLPVAAVLESIRRAVVQDHELQAHSVVLAEAGSIPKTTSGKLQRFACREEFLKGDLKTVGISTIDDVSESPGAAPPARDEFTGTTAPENFKVRREKIFAAAAWQRRGMIEQDLSDRLLRLLRPATATLDSGLPLYALGVDSLAAAELKSFTAEAFGLDLPINTFLEEVSIEQLADRVLERISLEQLVYSVQTVEPAAADDGDWEILKI